MTTRLQKYKSLREEIAMMPDESFETPKQETVPNQNVVPKTIDQQPSISYASLMDVYKDDDSTKKHRCSAQKRELIWRVCVISIVIILIALLVVFGIIVFWR